MQSLNDRYGLDRHTELEFIGEKHLAIVKFVRRRLLVADGERFVEVVKKIHAVDPDMKVSLLCTGNICSKTVQLLEKNGVDVLTGDKDQS